MTADPWVPQAAGGAEVLDEVYACVRRYVVLPSDEAIDAVVLWIAATHGLPAFEHATRLAVHSPIKRCGKTRLLEIIAALAYNAVPTTNISVPALFRMIDASARPPTLLLDEADRLFGSVKKDEDNRDLIAVLNNGFRAGNPTWRCVGPMQIPTPFSNYAMAAVVGIGRKPDTIEDRAVNITMRRRLPGETVAKFRLRTDLPRLHELRDRLGEWVETQKAVLAAPVAAMPDELEDRAEDTWEPLISVADAAGGTWPARARQAAVRLSREAAVDDAEQLEIRLLADVKIVFTEAAIADFLSTSDLLAGLRRLDESPWADFDLTARKLALRLGKFGVKPGHNTAKTERGYHLRDFNDPFGRYLPSDSSDPSETAADLHERRDGSELPDGSTRPASATRPRESAGQTAHGRVRTGRTDTPDDLAVETVLDVFGDRVTHVERVAG
ncbi:MAG: DUF3631 domain-containing protein [Actinomycetota bacterium]|nr:DUF3631 domain-containing protein [Actinomycetota bacterium]